MARFYEKGAYQVEERETSNGQTREWLDNSEWKKGSLSPSQALRYSHNTHSARSHRLPVEKLDNGSVLNRSKSGEREQHAEPVMARPMSHAGFRYCEPEDFYAHNAMKRESPSQLIFAKDHGCFRSRQNQEFGELESEDRQRRERRGAEGSGGVHDRRSSSLHRPRQRGVQRDQTSYARLNRSSESAAREGEGERETPFFSVHGRTHQGGESSRPGSPGPVAGVGDIVNTEHGFSIQLDVRHFRAEEIKVILTGDLLCISGERIERAPTAQTLRRSFSRKYCMPADIRLESISSHLADNGYLIVTGSRRGWKETQILSHPPSYEAFERERENTTTEACRHSRRASSLISNV